MPHKIAVSLVFGFIEFPAAFLTNIASAVRESPERSNCTFRSASAEPCNAAERRTGGARQLQGVVRTQASYAPRSRHSVIAVLRAVSGPVKSMFGAISPEAPFGANATSRFNQVGNAHRTFVEMTPVSILGHFEG